MADLSQFLVNLDTPQPGGRQGESPRSAFTKYNDLLGELEGELEGITYEHISATAPVETYPFQPWVDTGVSPAAIRTRSIPARQLASALLTACGAMPTSLAASAGR